MALPRSYCKQFTMTLGPATTTGKLFAIRKAKKDGFKLVTPDMRPVHQLWVDNDNKTYTKIELGRAIEAKDENGEDILLPAPEKEQVESLLPLNDFNISIHAADDVSKFLFPDENQAYEFYPVRTDSKNKVINDPVNDQWYEFIKAIAKDPEVALLGECNLQGHEGLFRLGIFRDEIYLQKQMYPDELNQYEDLDRSVQIPQNLDVEARKFARAKVEPFDPRTFSNRKSAVIDAIRNGTYEPRSFQTKDEAASFSILDAIKSSYETV